MMTRIIINIFVKIVCINKVNRLKLLKIVCLCARTWTLALLARRFYIFIFPVFGVHNVRQNTLTLIIKYVKLFFKKKIKNDFANFMIYCSTFFRASFLMNEKRCTRECLSRSRGEWLIKILGDELTMRECVLFTRVSRFATIL